MRDDISAPRDANSKSTRGKYLTLVILVMWVIAVFVFTIFKFSGDAK
jgi:hypothetical protein